jgi:predicted enzyme related to lactoylglutathione lyase
VRQFWRSDDTTFHNRVVSSFIFNITFDCADPKSLAAFWSGVTGYDIGEAGDDFARLNAPDHRGVRHILFFRVDERKTVKNRMHVDLATRDADREIARLVALGASLVDGTPPRWRTGNGTRWVVMRDPEGNEFCLG